MSLVILSLYIYYYIIFIIETMYYIRYILDFILNNTMHIKNNSNNIYELLLSY